MPEPKQNTAADMYRLGEACESAFLRYKSAMIDRSPEEYKEFKANTSLYEVIAGMFYGAESQDELDGYMDKTPAELAEVYLQRIKENLRHEWTRRKEDQPPV